MSWGKERGGGEVAKLQFCGSHTAWWVRRPLRLPTEHPVTRVGHPAFLESRFIMEGCRGVLSLKGSVGQGQELPRGACHTHRHIDALEQAGAGVPASCPSTRPQIPVLGTPRNDHNPRPQRWKGREGHLISCQGWSGAGNEKEVSNSTKGT